MKILLGYSYYRGEPDVKETTELWLERLRTQGIDVHPYCLTIDPPNTPIVWPELDVLWRNGDRKLLKHYSKLARKLREYDVFINWNGINLHPEFVSSLPTFNVYGCFDDPESSEQLSKPVASSYDLCMVGNIAELATYKSWGANHVYFWPNGFRIEDYDPNLTEEDIREVKRNVDVVFLGERVNEWRRDRIDKFAKNFPQGKYYGRGWDSGFLPEKKRIALLQDSKIGINMHNSTGPINTRTFYLPANGVMQICDNKKNLGKIYKLNKEVVGFDNLKEAVEACRYYLQNDRERIDIAIAGWKRALKDYNEKAVFDVLIEKVNKHYFKKNFSSAKPIEMIKTHTKNTVLKNVVFKNTIRIRTLAGKVIKG